MPRDKFDFASYCRKERVYVSAAINAGCEPMTQKRWMRWATSSDRDGGDMDEEGARSQWEYFKARQNMCEQDQKGRDKALRIWCPTKQFKRVTIGKEESNELKMSMKPINAPGEEDIADFRAGVAKAGFTSLQSEGWKQFGGGASASGFVDVAGFTSAGGEFDVGQRPTGVDFSKILEGVGGVSVAVKQDATLKKKKTQSEQQQQQQQNTGSAGDGDGSNHE